MTTERRAIGQNKEFTVRNEPLNSRKRAHLLEQDETVHLNSPNGELILAHENGQQSLYWGFDSIDSMRKEFAAMWEEALVSVDRDEIDYLSMNLSQVSTREMVIDRVMEIDSKEFCLEDMKWVVLMVLFNVPGKENAYAQMEDLLFEEPEGPLH
jgi:hypothetical protein